MTLPAISRVDCIVIDDVDARRFAQAQLSGDVDALVPGHWQWNAWLNAKGRVQALMHLVDPGDGTLLAVMRGGDAEASRALLGRYLLRMRANLSIQTFTGRHDGPAPQGSVRIDAGQLVLGYGSRSLRLDSTLQPPDPVSRDAWRLADIREGWPSLPDGEATFLPPALGLEHLGAVSFGKGCYPGQEIAARLHYLGRGKYQLCHLQGTSKNHRRPREGGDPVTYATGTETALDSRLRGNDEQKLALGAGLQGSPSLPLGEARDSDGKMIAWVLDAVTRQGATEALAVVPTNASSEINIMDNKYIINMRFDP